MVVVAKLLARVMGPTGGVVEPWCERVVPGQTVFGPVLPGHLDQVYPDRVGIPQYIVKCVQRTPVGR